MMIECGSTKEELKSMEKTLRKEVETSVKKAMEGGPPPIDELYTDIFCGPDGKNEYPAEIRMPDVDKSKVFG